MDVAPVLRVCFSEYWYNQGKPEKDDTCLHCCVRAVLRKSSNECGVATARETTNKKNKESTECRKERIEEPNKDERRREEEQTGR